MMMSSSSGSNTVVWVIVGVLAFLGVVLLIASGNKDDKPNQPQQKQPGGLEQMLNNQMGSNDSSLSDTPGAPTPPPAPEPKPDGEGEGEGETPEGETPAE